MEQFGIFYFFKHEDGEHTMMLGDSTSAHQACPGQAECRLQSRRGRPGCGRRRESVEHRAGAAQRQALAHRLQLHHLHNRSRASESTIYTVGSNDSMEIFDYPGLHGTPIRWHRDGQAAHAGRRGYLTRLPTASSVCRAFTTGYKFNLEDHPLDAMNASYLLTEIQHVGLGGGHLSRRLRGGGRHYSNNFTCIPADVPFRPARLTPKPFVQGPQTATVVGKSSDQDQRRRPVRGRRRRRDLGGQVGPGPGAVPVGPQEGRFLLGSRLAGLGRAGLGHDQYSPRRPGSHRELS